MVQYDTTEEYQAVTEYFGLSVKPLNPSGPVTRGGGCESTPQQWLRVFLIKISISN